MRSCTGDRWSWDRKEHSLLTLGLFVICCSFDSFFFFVCLPLNKYRYETNIIHPPLIAGTCHVSPIAEGPILLCRLYPCTFKLKYLNLALLLSVSLSLFYVPRGYERRRFYGQFRRSRPLQVVRIQRLSEGQRRAVPGYFGGRLDIREIQEGKGNRSRWRDATPFHSSHSHTSRLSSLVCCVHICFSISPSMYSLVRVFNLQILLVRMKHNSRYFFLVLFCRYKEGNPGLQLLQRNCRRMLP